MKKQKKIKPDEIYNIGPVTIARYGKLVRLVNNYTDEERENFLKKAASEYSYIKDHISEIVLEIREIISKVHPLHLLQRDYFYYFETNASIKSEADLKEDQIIALRLLDYVQSIISTIPLKNEYEEFTEEYFERLIDKIKELYQSLNLPYILCRSASEQLKNENYNFEFDSIYTQAQMLWVNVRGHRYLIHNIEFLNDLLLPHNEAFTKLFHLTASEFISGLEKIELSLTKGVEEAGSEFFEIRKNMIDKVVNYKNNESNTVTFKEVFEKELTHEQQENFKMAFRKLFGLDLFDVGKMTGWPVSLLRELSWEPGENTDFFAEGEYCGWPLRIEPIKLRPFLWIDDKAYCFESMALMDNIYRVMQKTICRLLPDYKESWNRKQKEISENLPIKYFLNLLPNATFYKSIYFKWYSSKDNKVRTWHETDGLIIFDDHLIVLEVKAGAFTYESPATDFPSYIASIKNLLEAPAKQCTKFLQYFKSQDEISIYDSNHVRITKLEKQKFRHITACCVTLDSFTTLSAKAKSLSAIGIELENFPVLPISIDDLRVYRDIFDSPYVFLHFLEQRMNAFSSKALELDDELDHLGLYLTYNNYVAVADNFPDSQSITWNGYRKKIDEYYAQLYVEPTEAHKPLQEMPELFKDIIQLASDSPEPRNAKAISILLDLGGEERNNWELKVKEVFSKQRQGHRPIPINSFNKTTIILFIKQKDFTYPNKAWIYDYIYKAVLGAKCDEVLGVMLEYNEKDILSNIEFILVKEKDIPQERLPELQSQLEERTKSLTQSYLNVTDKSKVGRNDPCPCGSGRKFKKCHGQ